jgi:hypothetical protein
MSQIVVALEFVGLWLLVGIGLFLMTAGARRTLALAAVQMAGAASGTAGQPLARALGVALAVAGLACALGGLAMLVAFFVAH